jgi:hypothetical protein
MDSAVGNSCLRYQPIEEADLVQALGREAETQRHLHGDGVGQIGEMAVIVAPQQPALCLRHLEHGFGYGQAQIRALNQHETTAHGKAVDGSNHWFLQSAVHERIGHCRSRAAGAAAGERLFHILAGTEAAPAAGQDRNFQVSILPKLAPAFGKGGAHFAIEGIEPLWAIHAKELGFTRPRRRGED